MAVDSRSVVGPVTQASQPQTYTDPDAYRQFLTDRAATTFDLPDVTVFTDASGKEHTQEDLQRMGYRYDPGGTTTGGNSEAVTTQGGVYRVRDEGGQEGGMGQYYSEASAPSPDFKVSTRKAKAGDLGTRPYQGDGSDGIAPRGYDIYNSTLYGMDNNAGLRGKAVILPDGGKGMQAQYQKWLQKSSDIDPYYARLFTQIDNYHEGRFSANAPKDPQGHYQLVGETLRQWNKDAIPGLGDRIVDALPVAVMSAVGGAPLAMATQAAISGKIDPAQLAKTYVLSKFLPQIGDAAGNAVLSATGSKTLANIAGKVAPGAVGQVVNTGKLDLGNLALSTAGQAAGGAIGDATKNLTLGRIAGNIIAGGGDPYKTSIGLINTGLAPITAAVSAKQEEEKAKQLGKG